MGMKIKGKTFEVLTFISKHPDATVREIMDGVRVNSTSVVQHHILRLMATGYIQEQPRFKVLKRR